MYRLCLVFCVAAVSAQSPFDALDSRPGPYSGKAASLGPLYTAGLGATQNYRDNSYESNAVTPTPSPTPSIYRNPAVQQVYRKPTAAPLEPSRDYQHQAPVRIAPQQQNPRNQPQQFRQDPRLEAEELEEEKDEPDRLSLLLEQSKFNCLNKMTGYYADEELNCEVFHYCQDNAKHSWICPEGFTFHQVHLICMPPSGDISCKKSSQYHFVNEYLYKPLNQAEADNKPNVTLRYSERYYPADVYTDERESAEYQIASPTPAAGHRANPQVFLGQQPLNAISPGRPQPPVPAQFRLPTNQVFRSPEEVNIPLQQRRPIQQQQQQQPLRRFPQVRPEAEEYE